MSSFKLSELVTETTACRIIGGDKTPIHRSTLWRGINANRYPRPLKVGPASNRWCVSELLAVLEQAATERENEINPKTDAA